MLTKKKLTGLLSDAVERTFPGVITKHGKEEADKVISGFSNRELLMAGLLRESMFIVNNEALERTLQSIKDSGQPHSQRDVEEYVADPDNQKKAIEFALIRHDKEERYDGIKAEDVMEFADDLSDRVYNRITSLRYRLNFQHLDTLS